MTAFETYGSMILLHGSFYLISMLVIIWLFERERRPVETAIMAVTAVAPFFVIGLGILCLVFLTSLPNKYVVYAISPGSPALSLALAFPVLWLYFKVNVNLAGFYTIVLLIVSQFSPVFVRALLRLFEGKPSAMFYLLGYVALPIVLWIALRRIENPTNRMLTRCTITAAIISPTLVVGHGGAIILPAGMIWPFLLGGGVDIGFQLISLLISMCVTTIVLVFIYKTVARSQAKTQSDNTE